MAKAPKTIAAFPDLVTFGKLVREATPFKMLQHFDSLENKHGKKASFNAMKAYKAVRGLAAPETPEEWNVFRVGFRKTFDRLVSLGLIEGPESNKGAPQAKQTYRLTPQARQALRYL